MSELIKRLYRRYLDNELSQEDLQEFRRQVSEATDEELWRVMEEQMPARQLPKMEADIKKKLYDGICHSIRKEMWRHAAWKYAAVVAIVLLTVAQSYYILEQVFANREERMAGIVVKPGNKADIVLPDGTKVSMNSDTELKFRVRRGLYREVQILSGEAFFDVAKDEKCPFKVAARDVEIQVLGTSFNVRTYDDKIETSLFTGRVKLQGKSLHKIYELMPGEKMTYSEHTGLFSRGKNDVEVDAGWKNGYLIFRSAPLHEVLKQIERWYGVVIRLENRTYANDLLTGSYRNEKLEQVLNSISLQYKLDYQTKNDTIVIE